MKTKKWMGVLIAALALSIGFSASAQAETKAKKLGPPASSSDGAVSHAEQQLRNEARAPVVVTPPAPEAKPTQSKSDGKAAQKK